jgi:sugar phosphate isomerase/epimerase
MKIGVADYGMHVWDGGLFDLEERLLALKKIGYNGIERLEAGDSAAVVNRAITFHRLGMEFATCRGPRVEQGIEWGCAFGCKYVWLAPAAGRDINIDDFCRRCNKFIEACKKFNLTAALHNHLGTVIESQSELDYFMKKCPEAGLLLDIGHLFGAKGNVPKTLEKYYKRLVAVHFKDIFNLPDAKTKTSWHEKLRFCELGAGNAKLDYATPAEMLKKKKFDKWVFVEHDTHLRDPLLDLAVSFKKLNGILNK